MLISEETVAEMLIPKMFHRVWLGPAPMPKDFVMWGQRWLDLHPGWTMKHWTEDNLFSLTNQKQFDEATLMAQKCDILCIEILYRYGGVYLDCDFEPLKSIEELIRDDVLFAASEGSDWISGGIMGAIPEHAAFRELIERLPDSVYDHRNEPINHQTGPVFRTPVLGRFPIRVYPPSWFYPYGWWEPWRKDEVFPEAYAVHHWAGSWKREFRP